jgi:allantoinase
VLQDPGRYDYLPFDDRPKIAWPNGARLAFWVAPNIEHYELEPPKSPGRTPWLRPVPDVLNYSHRDYGNRVGVWRMMETMAKWGVRGSVSLNVALCDHFPEIIEAGNKLGWEWFSHGVYNTRYLYGMSEDEQREIIRDSIATIRKYSGQEMAGWLSPALSNTDETIDLLAEAGIQYTLDLMHDDQPTPLRVRKGRLISVPYSLEVNDVPLFGMRNASPRRYADILKAQFDQLYAEGAENAMVMCVPLHPYLIGQPHRIGALDEVLRHVTSHDGVWLATGREIAAWYYAHHYDAAVAWLAAHREVGQ